VSPIVILMAPRSGSSMVAGIFAAHGVWVGKDLRTKNEHNQEGFFEHNYLQRLTCSLFPGDEGWNEHVPPSMKQAILDKLVATAQADGYISGPWLYKSEAVQFPLWKGLNPKWVCVRRDADAIFKSSRNSGLVGKRSTDEQVRKTIQNNVEKMDYVVENLNGVNVYSDEVIDGDMSSLDRAFQYCGLALDSKKAASCIRPEHWHYRG